MSAANGPTVEILSGVDAVPADLWDALAPPDDPMWGREVFTAMERGAIGPDGYAYAVVREAGRVLAVLPLAAVHGLRLDRIVGERERRMLAPLRRWCPGLLRVPMLFCGNFLGQGHILSREPLPEPVAGLLVRTVLTHARRHRLGTVIFKDFAPDELTPLRPALEAAGFFEVASMPDTELTLGYGSFEEYVAALPAKARRNVRSKVRKFKARDDLRIEVLADFVSLVPRMLELYGQVMERADQTLDVLDASFLRALHRPDGPEQRLVACFEGDRLVAYLLCLFRGDGAIGARIGLDYRLAHQAHLYHHVHYAAIELALARGCRHIRFAQTAYEPKRELGCALVEQRYALTHVRPLPRAVLRRLLPAALDAALARTLAPRS
ncbi:GNAT family N-acetyltransferase, partial [Streptomyces catenulae]|uniref:GNAT family N-acetyltransferase n=1 Tax=Streptomyces catenulae TaxID=66875 RepID=A0ABV2YS45_9ACTN